MNQQQTINAIQLNITNSKALLAFIIPAGISLIAVRGFLASKLASSQRLKAIAAERAKTMQRITRDNLTGTYHFESMVVCQPGITLVASKR